MSGENESAGLIGRIAELLKRFEEINLEKVEIRAEELTFIFEPTRVSTGLSSPEMVAESVLNHLALRMLDPSRRTRESVVPP